MKELTTTMTRVREKMLELEHDARVLSIQGKQEESFRKTKAAKLAKEHWIKLDRAYNQLWRAERKRLLESSNCPQRNMK